MAKLLILLLPNVSMGLFHFIRHFKLLQCVTCSLLAGGAGGQVLEEHYHLVWYLMVDITRIELFKCWLRFSYLDKI